MLSMRVQLQKARKRAFRAMGRLVGNDAYRKFVVLTRDRTGSNRLVQGLDSHEQVLCEYEVFAKLEGRDAAAVLSDQFGAEARWIRAKGFKIFYYHPQDETPVRFWQMIRETPDLHVIHLKRRNTLRALVSERVAYQSGVYGVRSRREQQALRDAAPKVRFEADKLRALFEKTSTWEAWGDEFFSDQPMLQLFYEDLAVDFQAGIDQAFEFLGVPARVAVTDFQRQSSGVLSDTLENYESLRTAFAGTEYAEFFDD